MGVKPGWLRELMAQEEALSELILGALLRRLALMIGLHRGLPSSVELRPRGGCWSSPHVSRSRTAGSTSSTTPSPSHAAGFRCRAGPDAGGDLGRAGAEEPHQRAAGPALGFAPAPEPAEVVDLLVVGPRPALAASVYGASEGLSTLTLEGVALGGPAGTSTRIETTSASRPGCPAPTWPPAPRCRQRSSAPITAPAQAAGLEPPVVADRHDGTRRDLDARALFVFIGADPHRVAPTASSRSTAPASSSPAPTPRSQARTRAAAAGSHHPRGLHRRRRPQRLPIKRVASAVGEGAMAVRLVHDHLARQIASGSFSGKTRR